MSHWVETYTMIRPPISSRTTNHAHLLLKIFLNLDFQTLSYSLVHTRQDLSPTSSFDSPEITDY